MGRAGIAAEDPMRRLELKLCCDCFVDYFTDTSYLYCCMMTKENFAAMYRGGVSK